MCISSVSLDIMLAYLFVLLSRKGNIYHIYNMHVSYLPQSVHHHHDTGTELFYQPSSSSHTPSDDPAVLNAQAEARLHECTDEFVAMPAPISVDAHIRRKLAAPDTGAGVFGALNYIESGGNVVAKKRGTDVFTDPDWAQVRVFCTWYVRI